MKWSAITTTAVSHNFQIKFANAFLKANSVGEFQIFLGIKDFKT